MERGKLDGRGAMREREREREEGGSEGGRMFGQRVRQGGREDKWREED